MLGNMIDLLLAQKAVLLADPILFYVDTISVQKYKPDVLPDFDTYAVLLSPDFEYEDNQGMTNALSYLWGVSIVCLVRNYHPENSVIGNVTPSGRGEFGFGILKHVYNVKESLRSREFGGLVDVSKKEMDAQINYNTVPAADREKFYHEVTIPWRGMSKLDGLPDVR